MLAIKRFLKPLPAGLSSGIDGLTIKDYKSRFVEPRSMLPYLPFQTYDPINELVLFEDGHNCGLFLELRPVPCEGRDNTRLAEIHDRLQQALTEGVEETHPPWVVQLITLSEPSLGDLVDRIGSYASGKSDYQAAWESVMGRHCAQVAAPSGVFRDEQTRRPWRGQQQRTYLTAWQWVNKRPLHESIEITNAAAVRLGSALSAAEVRFRPASERDLLGLMLPWLSDQPGGVNPYEYLDELAMPDSESPAGFDLAETCLPQRLMSQADGCWQVGTKHLVSLPVRLLTQAPQVGHLTGERKFGERKGTLMERLPVGSRWVSTIVYSPQPAIQEHLSHIAESSIGAGYESQIAADEAKQALKQLAKRDKLFRVSQTVYLAANSTKALDRKIKQATSVLRPEGLLLVDPKDDQLLTDAFLRNLPFAFDPQLDSAVTRRAKLTYGTHLASLAPLYGRSTGTGNPGITFFNAGGEPFCWDPLADRTRNAHLTLLGPSGSGKSAILNYMLMSMMWAHRPRVFIIDMKWPYPSFGLLVDYFQSQGLTVNRVRLTPSDAQPLPPFREAMQLLDESGAPLTVSLESEDEEAPEVRDILGEMVLLAETMITGGDNRSRSQMTRPDRLILSQAVLLAAQSVFGKQQYPLTEHVVAALRALGGDDNHDADPLRARWMAANLEYYTVGLAGRLFNRYGDPFPEADVTLIEPAVIAQEGHQDELTVAFMSILQNIQAVITKDAMDSRQTLVLADEKHVVAGNPYLGPYTVKIVKVWRSAGTWYWQATQDLEDYTEPMRPLINNSDWFMGMSMEKEQLSQLQAFKSLSPEQVGLIENCRIEKGKYSEGVIIHRNFSSIFRAVLPPLSLALAQSERDERAHRHQLMKDHGYSTHLEAAFHIANEIEQSRETNDEAAEEWQ